MKYVLFETTWGWMGLAGETRLLSRSILPISRGTSRQEIKDRLFLGLSIIPQEDPTLLAELQIQIKEYFQGRRIDFWNCDINYSGYPPFVKRVLYETSAIQYGTLATYGELALLSGSPRGARAAGQALKRNETPLIIPCHRVIGSQGKLTGFTAPGGLETKKTLLQLEGLL